MSKVKFIDIGVNLTDPVFRGVYHGIRRHPDDMKAVLERAENIGVEKMIITGGSLAESERALELARTDSKLYCTVGCHPTRCDAFSKSGNPTAYLENLNKLIDDNRDKVVAVGECGLDYDRLHFCARETQLEYFEKQFVLARSTRLPLFLHSRSCHDDFVSILRRNMDSCVGGGVVHSFTGTPEEAAQYIDLGFYIGINGCSLKTEANLEAMKSVQLDRLLLETDCPWCEVKTSHSGSHWVRTRWPSRKKEKWQQGECIKGRVEPCHIVQVLEVLAGARTETIDDIAAAAYNNAQKLFFTSNEQVQ